MAVPNKFRVWRLRAQVFAVGGALCLALICLLKVFGPGESAGGLIGLLLLFVLFWVGGLYCTHRYWKDFKDDEIGRGGSTKTAHDKWHLMHPPPNEY
jgi:hypothetical protein